MTHAWLSAEAASRQLQVMSGHGSTLALEPCGDPHLLPGWFALLVDTTSGHDSQYALWDCGADTLLPVGRHAASGYLVTALANFYTPLYGALADRPGDRSAIGRLARQLRASADAPAEIRLAPMATESPLFDHLQAGLRDGGWWVDRYYCFGNWYHPVAPGGYAAYFNERPSQTRNTVTRSAKKLARMSDYRLTIHTERDDALERAISDFVSVYSKSWKQPEPFPHFIPELCRRSATAGHLRLGVIHVGGQPMAAQLWLVMKGKAHIVKLAYDQSFDKASVGSVLTAELMKFVIDVDHVNEIDYLIGDDPYKQSWMTARRERWGVVAFNPFTMRGLIGAGRHFGGRLLARLRAWSTIVKEGTSTPPASSG